MKASFAGMTVAVLLWAWVDSADVLQSNAIKKYISLPLHIATIAREVLINSSELQEVI